MRTASPITAGQDHIQAVCNEIGERLGQMLRVEASLPVRLQDLLARLSELDWDAPSFIEENVERESRLVMKRAA
ncbi:MULTISPECIES: hypothetical protein [unclassified Bradyrhizobium]|jgi:hypothetical protein|uniref:Uncharacterized protein n=1 Tax=Bradyrhizobium sp. LLZ17 TaxID=3239388 RepID=A0AB39XHV2_9BRAD